MTRSRQRHQVCEIPPIRLLVTEYPLHQLSCPACGAATRGMARRGTDDAMLKYEGFADDITIKAWAKNALSRDTGAKYYLKIIDSVYNEKSRLIVPWGR